MIRQGDLYWYDFGLPRGSVPGYRRPVVVIQNDLANRSAIRTTLVCVLTTNLRLAYAPGNVLLDLGEANLPQRSVFNVSQIMTLNKIDLTDSAFIGTMSPVRVDAIVAGLSAFLRPVRPRR